MDRNDVGAERRDAGTGASAVGAVVGSVGPEGVGSSVLATSGLARADYADHYILTRDRGSSASPEIWARSMFGDAPDLIERLVWGVVLGLRLHTDKSPSTIAGWRITEQGDDWIRLSAASRNASAALVVRVTATTLELATFMQYDRGRARISWIPAGFIHRRLAPLLLRSTARGMREGTA